MKSPLFIDLLLELKLNAGLELKVKARTDELDITISQLEKQVIETKKAKAELVRIMQFQKAVLDSSGAMIITTDPDGTINLFNQAAENLLGYKAEEVIGIHKVKPMDIDVLNTIAPTVFCS